MKKSIRKIKNAIENPNFVGFMVELACKKACFWRYSFCGGGCEYVGDYGSEPVYQDVQPDLETEIREDVVLHFVVRTLKIHNSRAEAYIKQSGFADMIEELVYLKEDTENRQILYDVCWEDFNNDMPWRHKYTNSRTKGEQK